MKRLALVVLTSCLLAGCKPEGGPTPPASSPTATSRAPAANLPTAPPNHTPPKEGPPPVTGETKELQGGLKYIDIKVGDGPSPKKGQSVVVHYTGWLEDGKKFDSSLDRERPFDFPIGAGRVIQGWDEGVLTMKVGGKRRLIIPPQMGYGDKSVGNGLIPANSTLIFDVELLEVK